MTFTYILLWVLIGANAVMLIAGRKQNKVMKEQVDYADRLQKSADSLYDSAMKVLVEEKPKISAYNQILDAAEEHYRISLTGEVLISDLDKEFHAQVEGILDNTQEELNK